MGGRAVNKELLQKAGKVLTPLGVYLSESNIHRHPNFHPRAGDKELLVQYKARHLNEYKLVPMADNENQLVVFCFEAGVRLVDDSVDKDSDDFVQVEITAIFTSEYMLSDRSSFDEEAFGEFLEHNVRHHVWPYWREYVQSTCGRMGLPAIPVPHQFHGAAKSRANQDQGNSEQKDQA
ncbi:hypothetical protein [Alcanivorax sp.]|uniref:hypothetical protein n=1 Tax=Alcanivorax sp. TaxID=1872427 RepID=UPI002585EB0F|nr:hypothetical protein [Alcanivorax sp.]